MKEKPGRHKPRHLVLEAKVRRGALLVRTFGNGREIWSLSDGAAVLQEEASWLRHTLKLQPRDPGLFPGAAPQSYCL